jgi:hypothetical protein
MTLVQKDRYRDFLQDLADTLLYEEAKSIILEDRRSRQSDKSLATKNSLIYQEFWKREKASVYYNLYDLINKKSGRGDR